MSKVQLVRYWVQEGAHIALVFHGRKRLLVVRMTDEGISLQRVAKEEARFMKEVKGSIALAALRFRHFGERIKCDRNAARLLRGL